MREVKEAANRPVPKEQQKVYFEETGSFQATPVFDRASLTAGTKFSGPAIVEQIDTTVVIHPGQEVHVDKFGNLLIRTGAQ
jgi:N-methylhydantoinase A